MLNATRDLVLPDHDHRLLPAAVSGSREGLHGRSFKDALGDSRLPRAVPRRRGLPRRASRSCAGLDIVTDGDSRFDLTVGGKSWFYYPIERLGGITGHVDRTAAGGWTALRPGHILYEVMEAYQPAVVGERIEAGPLQYAALFKAGPAVHATGR